jgi:GNAT superfamily N-acetyltransferase
MPHPYTLTVTDAPAAGDFNTVEAGLIKFNERFAPPDAYRPLAVFVRSPSGRVVGGLLGNTYWNWLYVASLWLDDEVRGRRVGSEVLKLAETEAARRGCRHVHLDTMDFQALGFYQKLGYIMWGQLDDLPPGHTRFFLRKDLPAGT